ncbi:MAG: FecR domain-containing protein [Pseudomonas putida]
MKHAEQHQALRAAAQWHAKLCAKPDCPQNRSQWQAWLEHDPVHVWAWQQLERLQADLLGVPGPLARHALAAGMVAPARRTVLKGLVLGFGAAGLGWTGYRSAPVWLADTHTNMGERRHLTLEDGTRLALNSDSAVDIRYTDEQRLIILRQGEIFVETAADPRPLRVRSVHGDMRALGTRFNVRLHPQHTELTVVEHAVAVHNAATNHAVRVEAGMSLTFDEGMLAEPRVADLGRTEWNQGRLVLDDWRLDQALAELQRYRRGVLRCSDEVAGLRISGVYPLDDTDRILAAIAQALQLKIQTWTRLWVTLTP